MGTSQSKPPAKGGSPLVPSWADQDPPRIPDVSPLVEPDAVMAPSGQPEVFEPRRNAGLRRSLKKYMSSGERGDAQRALGHFSRSSAGGGAAGARRLARAARVGGGAISAISQAVGGQPISASGFDLRTLTGLPVSEAIDAIVNAFCPPGIVDEDSVRVAVGEALTEALSGLDQFDPAAINDFTVLVSIRAFVAELVFGAVVSVEGQAAEDVSPQVAIARENGLRALVREVTDVVATPILQGATQGLTQEAVANLVTRIAAVVYEEMSAW